MKPPWYAILTDNPLSWFLLLLVTFMGTAMLVGYACAPVEPERPVCVLCETEPVPTEVGP